MSSLVPNVQFCTHLIPQPLYNLFFISTTQLQEVEFQVIKVSCQQIETTIASLQKKYHDIQISIFSMKQSQGPPN
jgi:hypothetical protein